MLTRYAVNIGPGEWIGTHWWRGNVSFDKARIYMRKCEAVKACERYNKYSTTGKPARVMSLFINQGDFIEF